MEPTFGGPLDLACCHLVLFLCGMLSVFEEALPPFPLSYTLSPLWDSGWWTPLGESPVSLYDWQAVGPPCFATLWDMCWFGVWTDPWDWPKIWLLGSGCLPLYFYLLILIVDIEFVWMAT